jgi:hypothetical protein
VVLRCETSVLGDSGAPGVEGADPGGALVLVVGCLGAPMLGDSGACSRCSGADADSDPGLRRFGFLVYFRCRQPVSLRDSGVEL